MSLSSVNDNIMNEANTSLNFNSFVDQVTDRVKSSFPHMSSLEISDQDVSSLNTSDMLEIGDTVSASADESYAGNGKCNELSAGNFDASNTCMSVEYREVIRDCGEVSPICAPGNFPNNMCMKFDHNNCICIENELSLDKVEESMKHLSFELHSELVDPCPLGISENANGISTAEKNEPTSSAEECKENGKLEYQRSCDTVFCKSGAPCLDAPPHDKDTSGSAASSVAPDSDYNMVTASEGLISPSCSPFSVESLVVSANEASVFVETGTEKGVESSLEEDRASSEEREDSKRGVADGCSLSNSDDPGKGRDTDKNDNSDTKNNWVPTVGSDDGKASDCSCKRGETVGGEDVGVVLMGTWNELRAALRQVHRKLVPSNYKSGGGLPSSQSYPSVSRIKALAHTILAHDPHFLYMRVSQIVHELCIELKVRLLSTIQDEVTSDAAADFIHGVCESYQWLMNVCEAVQPAFEKLDRDHLSHFGFNWVTFNMHAFHVAVLNDPDVHDYLTQYLEKAEYAGHGKDAIACFHSLKCTLEVAEEVYSRAETLLQEYAMERAAVSARRRQVLSEWNHLSLKKHPMPSTEVLKCSQSASPARVLSPKGAVSQGAEGADWEDLGHPHCLCTEVPCSSRCPAVGQDATALTPPSSGKEGTSNSQSPSPSSCECHFCNASFTASHLSATDVLPPTAGVLLPPLAQPQLSLYPHIHGTPSGSDIVISHTNGIDLSTSSLSQASSKPPIFTNPYLGSDFLTEQLMREWDLLYGDTLSPPGTLSLPPTTTTTVLVSSTVSQPRDPQSSTHSKCGSPLVTSQSTQPVMCTLGPSSAPFDRMNSTSTASGSPGQELAGRSVITHTRSYKDPSSASPGGSESESSCRDEWSSSDESDVSSSDSTDGGHQESRCNCCYCHLLQQKEGGGRERYSDRRERLLKILSRKKNASSSSSSATSSITNTAGKVLTRAQDNRSLDEIVNYIEGGSSTRTQDAKKLSKRPRHKLTKRVSVKRELEDTGEEGKPPEEEEDGPLAELRRRAPDVTITVVRPGQQQGKGTTPTKPAVSQASYQQAAKTEEPSSFLKPLSSGTSGMVRATSEGSESSYVSGKIARSCGEKEQAGCGAGGLSSLIKGMEALNTGENNKDGKSSQMVTIRRVMDPISAEPTVTITLKGEEPEKDKLLFKLVHGQGTKDVASPATREPQSSVPPLKIPDGLSQEEVQKLKRKHKKIAKRARRRARLEEVAQKEQMKQLHFQKQHEIIRQREEHIRQQQLALQRQKEELIRQQRMEELSNSASEKDKGKDARKGKNVSAVVYDGDDMARNFNLPPGVSINKVAGQPGMVTISNNMGGPFGGQPFLPNPNLYPNPLLSGFGSSSVLHQDMALSGTPLGFSDMYCSGVSTMPKENKSQQTTVNAKTSKPSNSSSQKIEKKDAIQKKQAGPSNNSNKGKSPSSKTTITPGKGNAKSKKDKVSSAKDKSASGKTKSQTTPPVQNNIKKDKNEKSKKDGPVKEGKQIKKENAVSREPRPGMTSEEIIDAAVRGDIDLCYLNHTQKKKYKRIMKQIVAEKEQEMQQQKEEDELMDKVYMISKGYTVPSENEDKPTKGKNSKKASKAGSAHTIQSSSELVNSCEESIQNNSSVSNPNKREGNRKKNAKNSGSKPLEEEQSKGKGTHSPVGKGVSGSSGDNKVISTGAVTSRTHKVGNKENRQQTKRTHATEQQSVNMVNPQVQLKNLNKNKVPEKTNGVNSNRKQTVLRNTQPSRVSNPSQTEQRLPANAPVQQSYAANRPNRDSQRTSNAKRNGRNQGPLKGDSTVVQVANSSARSSAYSSGQSSYKPDANYCDDLHSDVHQFGYSGGSSVQPYGPIGFSANDGIGHEARYAQYLAANASTLASAGSYHTDAPKPNIGSSNCSPYLENHVKNARTCSEENFMKSMRRQRKGNLEDMTTIDSVFTPKDIAEGELDETERDVEAFKRFCLYNVPRHVGEKPKVNFNVKDIMIKRKP